MWRRLSSAPMCDAAAAIVVVVLLGSLARLALTVASSVGRLVCRMNECSWCQPRPITRYSTLTQCLLLLLASGCCRKRRRGAANDTALSFLCAFYSGPGRSSDRRSSNLLRLDYWNRDFFSLWLGGHRTKFWVCISRKLLGHMCMPMRSVLKKQKTFSISIMKAWPIKTLPYAIVTSKCRKNAGHKLALEAIRWSHGLN